MKFENFDFNQKCQIFIENIEKDYGKEIKIKYEKLDEHTHGQAECKNGFPIIILNKNIIEKEIVIIHEAYHLRLQYDGMPKIHYSPSSRLRGSFNEDDFTRFHTKFWDKISHHFFFPKMKKELDINPYLITKKEIDKILANNKFYADNISEMYIVGLIFQTWIEIDDENYLHKLKEFIKKRYNSKGISKGEHLIKIMNENPLTDLALLNKIVGL